MKTLSQITAAFLLMLLLTPAFPLCSQVAPGACGQGAEQPERRMFVEPSTATVSLGKASLTVSPLSRKEKYYVGNYQIKVTPYFFKNETGVLMLGSGEDLLAKLAAGSAVTFTGKSTSNKDGEVKTVNGKATPTTSDHGAVNFTVFTNNGPVTFHTSYRIGQ